MYKLTTIGLTLLLGILLSACGASSPAVPGSASEPTTDTMVEPTTDAMAEPTTAGTTGQSALITIDEIQAAADAWYGEAVTVNGDVTQVYNDLAFTVSDTAAVAGPLLVIAPNGATLSQGQSVEISGTVQQLDVTQIQEELGITLGPDVEMLAGQPVLIADQVDG